MQAATAATLVSLRHAPPPSSRQPLLASPPPKLQQIALQTHPLNSGCRCAPIKSNAVTYDMSTVDYSSSTSVFPAEACETIGGDACAAEMHPEAKLPESKSNERLASTETVDRDYLDYNDPKTVFPGEACDDLGGEFCQPPYQAGVF